MSGFATALPLRLLDLAASLLRPMHPPHLAVLRTTRSADVLTFGPNNVLFVGDIAGARSMLLRSGMRI